MCHGSDDLAPSLNPPNSFALRLELTGREGCAGKGEGQGVWLCLSHVTTALTRRRSIQRDKPSQVAVGGQDEEVVMDTEGSAASEEPFSVHIQRTAERVQTNHTLLWEGPERGTGMTGVDATSRVLGGTYLFPKVGQCYLLTCLVWEF